MYILFFFVKKKKSEGPSDATARIARQLLERSTRGNFFVNTMW